MGGYAELLRAQAPARRATAAPPEQTGQGLGFAADGRPMGGYAEWLSGERV
jgi:hypothetical protein